MKYRSYILDCMKRFTTSRRYSREKEAFRHENGLSNKVKIIFTDYEELGMLGAKAFIKENKDILKDKIIINFDCIGRGSNMLITSSPKSNLASDIKNHFRELGQNLIYYPISCSDDKAFHKKGYEAVGLVRADLDSKGNKNIPWVHTANDTVENVSPDRILEVINPVYSFINNYLESKYCPHNKVVAATTENAKDQD